MDFQPARDRRGIFLTAEWRHLVMLNYPIERSLIEPLVPPGLDLDEHESITYVSLVGFLFLKTRVGGISFPFHRNFEEVNLRFYVRQQTPEGWRRGVIFVREIVPRRAIATLARVFYGEPYSAFRCNIQSKKRPGNCIAATNGSTTDGLNSLPLRPSANPNRSSPVHSRNSSLNTIGVTRHAADAALNTRSNILLGESDYATEAHFEGDVASLYGAGFVGPLSEPATSAFIAEGSAVSVRRGSPLA